MGHSEFLETVKRYPLYSNLFELFALGGGDAKTSSSHLIVPLTPTSHLVILSVPNVYRHYPSNGKIR